MDRCVVQIDGSEKLDLENEYEQNTNFFRRAR